MLQIHLHNTFFLRPIFRFITSFLNQILLDLRKRKMGFLKSSFTFHHLYLGTFVLKFTVFRKIGILERDQKAGH